MTLEPERVLLITRNLPPLRGGMERLNLHMAKELANLADVDVIGPSGARSELRRVPSVKEVPIRPLWRFFVASLLAGLRVAWRRRPAVVVAGSGLCAPFAYLAARCVRARSAVYVHGLDLVVSNRLYRVFWLPFIRRCDICIANSKNTARLAMERGVVPERLHVVNPGVTLPKTRPSDEDTAKFCARIGWTGKRVLLSVGRLTERKGLVDFVERVMPELVASDPKIVLAVVGNDAPDALNGKGMLEHIVQRSGELGLQQAVIMHGELSEHDLDLAYAAADLAVFPVKELSADVEGFGMVAVEAAARGLPTVAFASGGVVDAVLDGKSGWLVSPGDYPAFTQAIFHGLTIGRAAMAASATIFAERFEWKHFGHEIAKALNLGAQTQGESAVYP